MTKTYQEKLKDIRWSEKRSRIIIRDRSTCQYCFAKNVTLQVHHFHYPESPADPWDSHDDDLITLCAACHDSVMKSHHREQFETGMREQSRMERRRQLMTEALFTEAWKEQQAALSALERERSLKESLECTCDSCIAERTEKSRLTGLGSTFETSQTPEEYLRRIDVLRGQARQLLGESEGGQ